MRTPPGCLAALALAMSLCGSVRGSPVGSSPAEWHPLLEDAARGPDDATIPKDRASAPDVLSLECAHVGGNRVAWRIRFAEPYVSEGMTLILYLDVDADEHTGRTGEWVQGTDRMLVLSDGETRAMFQSGAGRGRRTVSRVRGNAVIFEDDLEMLAARIRGSAPRHCPPFEWRFRARVLSHTIPQPHDQDGTAWAAGEILIDPSRTRPPGDEESPAPEVRDLVVVWGPGGKARIRFTTSEPLAVLIEGPGRAAPVGDNGILRNHAWSLSGIPPGDRLDHTIVLLDDLNERMAEVKIEKGGAAKRSVSIGRRRVAVFLSTDHEHLPASLASGPPLRWPVSGGIPFPREQLSSPGHVRLLDPAGRERAIQTEALSVWPDGSIRWLLIEFVAKLPDEAQSEFALEYGSRVRAAKSRNAKGSPDVLWSEVLAWPGGAAGMLSPAESECVVEREGPVHSIRLHTGRYAADGTAAPFVRRLRLHTYPGLPFVRIDHTLSVEGDEVFSPLKSLRLVFDVDPETSGGSGIDPAWTPPPDSAYTAHITHREIETGTAAARRREPGELPGFVTGPSARGRSVLAVRHFAENWPKALLAADRCLVADLFPELTADEYTDRPEPGEMLYYWFDEGVYRLKRGVRKTHELLWASLPPDGGDREIEALVHWFNNPPVVRARANWIASTGAAGIFEPPMPGRFGDYEQMVRSGFRSFEETRRSLGEYGFLNFGDWYGERGRNWGNLEYDLAHTLWLEWLRSEEDRYLRRAEQAAWHSGDVDVVHADPSAMNIGRMWGHSVGHTGGYFPEGAFGMEAIFTRGFWDFGHTWCEGMLNLHLATGEPRYCENGLLVADQLARYGALDFRMASERSAGWPVVALVAAFEFTGDPFYLNGAKIFARAALERQNPETGVFPWRIGDCKHTPVHVGGKPFMAGVLLTGLSRLHRNLPDTAEERPFRDQLAASIVKGCDWLLNRAWVEDGGGFIYAECADFAGKVSDAGAWMACEALAYATELSGDPVYLEKAAVAVNTALRSETRDWGKGLAMRMRFAPYFLPALSKRGLIEIGGTYDSGTGE